jgi:transcriptional regulator with PAS, ATPase and Fis domain
MADARDTETLPNRDRALVQSFVLEVIEGPDKGKRFVSTQERAVVGSHESANLALNDAAVSRFHFEIVIDSRGVRLRDLESLNGTTLDGVTVMHAVPGDGAVIGLGRTRIRFGLATETTEVALSTRGRFGLAVGRSYAMARLFAVLERAAASHATVLIEGETGTGKELIAESLHAEGERKDGPFIVVDCAAIPNALLESELFGHARGAFTGAVSARQGAFEAASGGTLFLDEIGDLAPDLQPKLLRVLERREVKRVGETTPTPVDVRIIAATNHSLGALVNAKRFRSDLFYRLAVVEVRLPPLRERLDDLPVLVEHILASLGATLAPQAPELRAATFIAELARHSWPGNVRELRNYIERCLTLSERAPLTDDPGQPAPAPVDVSVPLKRAREQAIATFEKRYLVALLAKHRDNVAAAARTAGVDRAHLYRLLWRYGLR